MFRICFFGAKIDSGGCHEAHDSESSPSNSTARKEHLASAAMDPNSFNLAFSDAVPAGSRKTWMPERQTTPKEPSVVSLPSPAEPHPPSPEIRGHSANVLRNINASRIRRPDRQYVVRCDPQRILEGLRLQEVELGRGSFGIVLRGSYWGTCCAVKLMLSASLDESAVRELLLGPKLSHVNIVQTFTTRCAKLTDALFDFLESNNRSKLSQPGDAAGAGDPAGAHPRMLGPVPLHSGDGFGDPVSTRDGPDPMIMLHRVLYDFKAEVGKVLVVSVQEYCELNTLDWAIRKDIFKPSQRWGLRIALRSLLRCATEVARGVLHLHDAGIVHGDLKPCNVLLKSAQEDIRGFIAKVADFGLSHVLPSAAKSMSTDSWGTVAYMAPEAFEGKVSRATDVWSFGVVLWQMLTGNRPYRGFKLCELIAAVRTGHAALQWPEEGEAASMAPGVVHLGKLCMSPNPDNRPTMEQVLQTLVDIEKEIRAKLLQTRLQKKNDSPQQQPQQQPSSEREPTIEGAVAPILATAVAEGMTAAAVAVAARAAVEEPPNVASGGHILDRLFL